MSMPPTEAAIDAIARNPNVTAAIERLAICYAESMHRTTRTNATIRAEDEVLSRVGKAVWICVQDAMSTDAAADVPATDIRPAVGGAGGAAGPGRVIGRDTTIALTMDNREKSPFPSPAIRRSIERLLYDDPPGSDGDGKAWWGKALADGWIAEPVCRDTEADAGMCETHRDVCDNWSAAFPISAPDGVCGGDVVVLTGDEVTGS